MNNLSVNNKKFVYKLLLVTFGYTLVVSKIIGGFNVSPSDIVILVILIQLFMQNRLRFSFASIFVMILIAYRILISITIMQNIIITNWLSMSVVTKFITCLIYFYVATLFTNTEVKIILKSFIRANVFIGIVGLFVVFIGMSSTFPFLFGSDRYVGLMNDPNYYSLMELITLVLVITSDKFVKHRKLTILALIPAVLISESKTSFIVLAICLLMMLVRYTKKLWKKRQLHQITLLYTPIVLSVIFLIFKKNEIFNNLQMLAYSQKMGVFRRLFTIFTGDALNSNGSNRTEVWKYAIGVIEKTHVLGTGFSDYTDVVSVLFGRGIVAHNTYLQVICEWGVIFGVPFFMILLLYLIRALRSSNRSIFTLGAVQVVVMIYFFVLSLNNSRIVWLLWGLLYVSIKKEKSRRR